MVTRIYEGDKNETGGTGIEVTENKVINLILRSLNNLIKVNDNNEVYVDLQLEDGIENSDTLLIGVNVGRVLQADGRPVTGTLISGQTTSGDRVKVLYGDDGKIRVDNGTGEREILAYEYNAGTGIQILNGYDYSAMQGPCPDGFHIPTKVERASVYNIWTSLGGGDNDPDNFGIALKLPFAGSRAYFDGTLGGTGTHGYYWSSSKYGVDSASALAFYSGGGLYPEHGNSRSECYCIRSFKDQPVIPTVSWTKLYGNSISEGGIFWDSVSGLISLSSDGINWITMSDKNIGATTAWNNGDTLSTNNCGNYFQRGNNYGFDGISGNTPTTSSTLVDASGYGPGNYYSSSTFIITSVSPFDWSSVQNDNLWGGETGAILLKNVIKNTGVLSVDGKTGHVHIEQPNVCEITVQLVDTDYIGTATKVGDLVDGATIIGHSNGLQGLQGLSIAGVSYTVLNGIGALDNWTHFYGIYREGYGVIIYSFNNN